MVKVTSPIVVFLLAHADDEIFALHLFHKYRESAIQIFFLTDGSPSGNDFIIQVRQQESEKSIGDLGSHVSLTHFGVQYGVMDGLMFDTFDQKNFETLLNLLTPFQIAAVVSPHLEGGHQDHDATFLIAQKISSEFELPHISFPMYSSWIYRFPFFSTMKTHSGYSSERIRFAKRITFVRKSLRIIGHYKSQRKTWIGLGLPLFSKYLFSKVPYFKNSLVTVHNLDNLLFEQRSSLSKRDLELFWEKMHSWGSKH
jgi:LmbE family N-acetylglucosaminyl deacetylase